MKYNHFQNQSFKQINPIHFWPIECAEPSEDPRKSYVMRIRERDVLCLPYVDIGIPDFLEYNYPDPDMFIADRSKGLMTRMP